MEYSLIATIVALLLIPLLFILWVGFSRSKSRVYWLAVAVLVAAYLFLMHVSGAAWHWFGWYWRYFYWLLFTLAVGLFVWRRWTALPWWPDKKVRSWIGFSVVALVALPFLSSVPSLLTARTISGDPVKLRFPLHHGTFYVGHGGSNEVVNRHHIVPAQRYALDISGLNGLGMRARGLLPQEVSAYAIYGADLLAPCEGEVLGVKDGLPDAAPPELPSEISRENVAGNYVTIYCKDVTVLLAHLQSGSISVRQGDRVAVGQLIAKMGNSGNTSEPHLHIHAVRGRQSDYEQVGWQAEGVPMLMDGRYLIRNDRVVVE